MIATRVFISRSGNPVSAGKIPYVPTLHTQTHGAGEHQHCDSERPHRHRREATLTQKVQKSEHDEGVQTEFVTKHAFHLKRGDSADRNVVNDGGAEVDADPRAEP